MTAGEVMTFREALRQGMRDALLQDERVLLIGEDIGRYGGCYACTKGLWDEFGPERVRDAPLSEAGFVGAAIGAALGGLHPIVEIMTINFSLLALDQIIHNAATLRHMSGGQVSVPLVLRMATGAGRQVAAQHSHSFENYFAHVPGLRVVAPSNVQDARSVLPWALTVDDPVVVVEHVGLYGVEGDPTPAASPLAWNRAAVRRAGKDITLVTYGGTVPKTLEAAKELATMGIDAEVVDLRSLRPLDEDTVLQSVRKTGRLVVVDEGWKRCSLAAEVMAFAAEHALYDLDGPLLRVCSADVPVPYAKHLEDLVLPQVKRIVDKVQEGVRRHG